MMLYQKVEESETQTRAFKIEFDGNKYTLCMIRDLNWADIWIDVTIEDLKQIRAVIDDEIRSRPVDEKEVSK